MEQAPRLEHPADGSDLNTELIERSERMLELSEQIAQLRESLQAYAGQNLTGDVLQQADDIAQSLMEAEATLAQLEMVSVQERAMFPAVPPADYPGIYQIVPESSRQPLSPAATDNRPATPTLMYGT